ncbi:MAG: DUF6288 domain-containing protein [Akkermansiaceae bacterium]|nr:DUF6288 domain-containing protein [Akkermansiaceae bacterium]
MRTQSILHGRVLFPSLAFALSIAGVCTAGTPPDLTTPDGMASTKLAMQRDFGGGNIKTQTFNLGPTGLRGWFHLENSDGSKVATGRISDASRQILVTHASSPGNGQIQVDDVILGAIAASSGTVPSFTSDARKALGAAITNAEKAGAGTLRLKRWRTGSTTDVNITIPILGSYTATAPYNCPKSTAILANARNQMVGELIADANFLNCGQAHADALHALALLASVQPGDPNYSTVRTRLQTFARSLSSQVPPLQFDELNAPWVWAPAYRLVFLSEYYLLTNDSQVVPTIKGFTLWLAEYQSMWGTYNHGPGQFLQDNSGRRFAAGYGPVNAVGNIANLAMVLGRKALQTAGQAIDPKIDTAIQRAAGFLGSHVNKGSIQYGEHFPGASSHASNGKDASAAVFFGLQDNYAVQAEYFSRMATAGWIGIELGHAGQELGILWTGLGAGMGGDAAASEYFKQMLWRFDIQRRTNGSFTNDSFYDDFHNGGWTADDTYLGESSNYDLKATAIYLLTYSLPLKRLYITGKQANPAYTLDAAKVANAVSAGSFPLDRTSLSIPQLFTALGEYDPVVRYYASVELAARTLSGTDLTNLRGLLASPNPNIRQSAAEALGIRKDATALPTLVGMLNDSDIWVRQKAAAAIDKYDTSTVSPYRDTLLNAFIANAPTDPNVINWIDPLQFSQSTLSSVIFKKLAVQTINAPKTTRLYPALRAGLLLPTGSYRGPVTAFARNRLNLTDLQNLFPELVQVVSSDTPADRMFVAGVRADAVAFMAQNKITEGIPIFLEVIETQTPGGFNREYLVEACRALASYGDAARYTLPRLRVVLADWNTRLWDNELPHEDLSATIAILENATSASATNLGKCVANSQIVTTTGAQSITLTGASPIGSISFQKLTDPANGTLTGTAPNLTYTPNSGFTGTDKFTFRTQDSLTTSEPATVAIIVGTAGTGIVGAYFDNADFTSQVLTRTDPQINFDWGTGSPDPSIGADTFSTRWSGYLLAPETGTYTLSGLTSDGVRAYLNGVPVINNLNDQSTRWTDGQSISLTAGQKVPLFLEYYENTGSAVAELKWTGPSFAGLNGNIIPQAYLFESNSSGGTDTTAPVISTLSPADNATGVAHAADLVATFSENIVRGTGNITLKNLSDATQMTIAITDTTQVWISGSTLTINPTANLLTSKNYAVQIAATAIKGLANNLFAGITDDSTWNFTTATTAPDTTAPTPNPMTFASPPAAVGSSSITMTATTASDPSGVEYRFNNVTLATSSAWQDSPVYTATGLISATSYTFTVQARDKSPAQNTTTASASASATTQSTGTLDAMGLNFFVCPGNPADHNTVTLEAGESAGVGACNVSGWQNYEVPWGLDSPASPFTLTNTLGATATMTLNDVRNGGTDNDQPNPNFGGSGDLMDSLANATEDPYDESAKFDMAVSNIPYPLYDLIVYLTGNGGVLGDGTGKLILNGGAVQNFTVSVPFNGFVEITNATTAGNYVIFRKLRTPSLALKVWGNGFNHIGPAGFQIVKDTSGVLPPGPASNPNPQDTNVGHASNTDLSWTAGIDAVSRDVYFGTNPTPGASELKGNQTATTYDPGTLANGTYYWRIDEVNADGTTPSPVWSFSVGPPAKAFRPMPWNGMKAVATNVGTLKWVAGKSATASSHDVYFGTDPTPDSSEFKGNQTGTTYNPGPLSPGTTYYWRVDQVNAQGTMTGDVWSFTTPGSSANKVKIFILAGQSNMVGQGEINPIGTPGTLAYTYNNDPVAYAHLKVGGNWAVRDDAWIWYNRDGTLVKGGLTTGYRADSNNIGPELQFGHAMGIHYGQKVLLIKTAWGGKSLQTDFRPPSAGWNFDVPGKAGDQGYYFTEMLKDVINATANLQTHFPAYNPADGFEFAGFAWHQGWNDLVSTAASAEYEANMEKFIKDVRFAVGVPNLPFVIATTGQSDPTNYSQVELAQLKMEDFTKYPAFNGNVSVVDAKGFWIPASSSPADQGYHWNRNAKSYYMIGDALASEMLGLQPDTTAPSPDPMTFATPPAALGQTSITMTATTATDPSGIEYFFECTGGGGHSSAWQNSPTYTDTGLTGAAH